MYLAPENFRSSLTRRFTQTPENFACQMISYRLIHLNYQFKKKKNESFEFTITNELKYRNA